MVVRLHNINKWAVLPPGAALALAGTDLHRVRVDFNCSRPTDIRLVEGEGDKMNVVFLANIVGLEAVEFVAAPGAHIVADSEGDVFYFTDEGTKDSHAIEQVSFTGLMTRRARNPQQELMMFKMQQNINARLALLDTAMSALNAARAEGASDDETVDDTGAAGGAGDGGEPAPEGAPAAPPAGA